MTSARSKSAAEASMKEVVREARVLSDSDEAERAAFRKYKRNSMRKSLTEGGQAPVAMVPRSMEPLTQELRRATRQLHRSSDSLINAKLALALFDRDGVSYACALRLFLPVFLNLEKLQWVHKDNPAIKKMPVYSGVAEKILKDLHHFQTSAPFVASSELEAAAAYVQHLRELSEETPELLCAYIYSMNMALFSGGRVLRELVSRALHASDAGGLCTFTLDPGLDAETAKAQLRQAMDEVGQLVDGHTRLALIEEAKKVFELNNMLVAALQLRQREIVHGVVFIGRGKVLAALIMLIALQLFVAVYLATADVI